MTNGVSLPLPWHNKANYESEVVKMKKEKIYCDRCGKKVKYPFNITHRIIKSKYTLMDIHDNYMDLCEDCSKSLTKWFKAKNDSNEQNDDFPCFHNNEGDLIKNIRKAYQGNIDVS